jgi:outer membrane protein assembly factor BamB/tRNA A-37 threonylcarbamoyl transferase component Bud32
MPGFDDHPRIPSVVPPRPLPAFDYDRLNVGDRIGVGGDADVYHATVAHEGETHPVAVKEPRFEGTLKQEALERFRNEAETWAKLDDHDNVVTVYAWSATPVPWLALEYMDGGSLADRIGSLDTAEAIWLAGRIAEGIRHGHRHGVAHLDIKPSNVLLRATEADAWPYPKVSDWGLSKLLLEHSASVEGLSPTHAAPEQFDADEFGQPDDITDIYQLGTVLYTMVAGEPPFSGSAAAVMQSVLRDEPAPPSAVDPAVPSAVDEIVMTALAKRKEERYQGLLPMIQDLDRAFEAHVDAGTADSADPEAALSAESSQATARIGRAAATASGGDGRSAGDGGDEPDGSSSGGVRSALSRRSVLGVLGAGILGGGVAVGVRRLVGTDRRGGEPSRPETETAGRPTTTAPPTATASGGSEAGDRSEPTLSERWSANRNVDYAWTVGRNFFFNGAGGSARAITDGIRWTGDKSIDGSQYHLGGDAFCYTADTVVFGFIADPGAERPFSRAGAQFYAYDRASGEEQWTVAAPDDGGHRQPVGATVAEGVAVLGCGDWSGTDPLVYGIDVSLGEQVWEVSYVDRRLNDVVSYAGRVLLCFDSGVTVVDPNTGSEVETREAIRPRDAVVQGNTLFAIDGEGVLGYRLDDDATEWRSPAIESVSTGLTVDNSLLVVGTGDGAVHALSLSTGERRWVGEVAGEVSRLALSPYNVWAVNSQSGLFALDRDDGDVVHRSTHDTGGNGIAVIDDVLLLGGTDANAYWIDG